MDARHYSASGTLRDGSAVAIRAQRPEDRDGIRSAVQQMGATSIQRRFFAPRRSFTEREAAFFLDIDFVRQVALVAVAKGDIVGGCRYIVGEPGVGEVAFTVADHWQGRGLGHFLMEHLAIVARVQGLHRFVADVLRDNAAMLGVFRGAGLPVAMHYDLGTVHVILDLIPAFSDSGAGHHA